VPIEIPTAGRKLTYFKLGGGAKLSLSVLPQETLRIGLGSIWTVIWLGLGLGLLVMLSRGRTRRANLRRLLCAMIPLGLIWFCLLPSNAGVAWWGFAVFLVGLISLGVRRRRSGA
jgi:hypothetical protein